jgi:hypothetical protein
MPIKRRGFYEKGIGFRKKSATSGSRLEGFGSFKLGPA